MFEALSPQFVCILVPGKHSEVKGRRKNKTFSQGLASLTSILKYFEDKCDLKIISTPNWIHWTGIMVGLEIEQEDFLSSVGDLLLRTCGDPPWKKVFL